MAKSGVKYAAAAALAAVLVGILVFGRWKQGERIRFVAKMGAGINAGNSLDSTNLRYYVPDASDLDYETFWGNPKIESALFQMIAEAGFGTVRIPVSWEDHMDDAGVVSAVWLSRVQEVVDMALAEGLYVILNTHEEKWLDLQLEREEEMTASYRRLWEQIAQTFADYDERLLFEGMNEPRLRGSEVEWTGEDEALRALVNRLNAAFVETVRESGGENENRYLLICAYADLSARTALSDLEVPKGNIIVAVHAYLPYRFCQQEEGTDAWSADNPDDVQEIDEAFETMYELFIKKNIPVILTEIGSIDKDNVQARAEWTSYYVSLARKKKIGYLWWDDGSGFAILDRENNCLRYPEIVSALVE